MIKVASLAKYRKQELAQFVCSTLMIVKQHGPMPRQIEERYRALQQQYTQWQDALRQQRPHELTAQLARLDAQRDQAIICLRKLCDGYAAHPYEPQHAAGRLLLEGIDRYGRKLYHLSYSEETAVLKHIAREFQTNPQYVTAVQFLQLEAVVEEMRTANARFETLFIRRLQEYSQEGPSPQALAGGVKEAYRFLVQHVQAHATLAPTPAGTLLTEHLNENIDYFNDIVARRRRGSRRPTQEDTPQPTVRSISALPSNSVA